MCLYVYMYLPIYVYHNLQVYLATHPPTIRYTGRSGRGTQTTHRKDERQPAPATTYRKPKDFVLS